MHFIKNNKKAFKIIMLVIFSAFFLTGCESWEEYQEDYAEVLMNTITCEYSINDDQQKMYPGLGVSIYADLFNVTLTSITQFGSTTRYLVKDGKIDDKNFSDSLGDDYFLVNLSPRQIKIQTTVVQDFIDRYKKDCACPQYISITDTDETTSYLKMDNYEGAKNYHLVKGNTCKSSTANKKPATTELTNCKSLLGDPLKTKTPAWYLKIVFKVAKYIAIILLIVLTIMDFIGAVASQDNDKLKKVVNRAIIRAIMCIVIFILPTLIEFILKYLNDRAVDLCSLGGE